MSEIRRRLTSSKLGIKTSKTNTAHRLRSVRVRPVLSRRSIRANFRRWEITSLCMVTNYASMILKRQKSNMKHANLRLTHALQTIPWLTWLLYCRDSRKRGESSMKRCNSKILKSIGSLKIRDRETKRLDCSTRSQWGNRSSGERRNVREQKRSGRRGLLTKRLSLTGSMNLRCSLMLYWPSTKRRMKMQEIPSLNRVTSTSVS